MTTRKEIDQKYLKQESQLEAEFFYIVNLGKPSQHRIERAGKTIAEFNQRHAVIWKSHYAELLAEGFVEPKPVPEPVMDYKAEILKLQDEVKKLQSLTA